MHFGSTFLTRLRMVLVGIWLGLFGVLFSSSISTVLYMIMSGEVIGFRLFRATGLAFAIRPKDGVARQGRRGGFHCYCSKVCWNNFSVLVRVRGHIQSSVSESPVATLNQGNVYVYTLPCSTVAYCLFDLNRSNY